MTEPVLFSPFRMRGLELPNRIVVSPMGQYSATPEGFATDWHLMHLGHLAVSGAGLVITEATAVEPAGRVSSACLGIWSDDHIAPLRAALAFCRRHGGASMGMQLAHAGRKGSVSVPWEKQVALDATNGGWQLKSASPIAYPGRPVPHALSVDELAEIRDAFAAAARRAAALDFDLLEIHNAHGYLLHSFLTPLANARTDAYGGALEGRMRFPLEVFDAVRAAWPADRPLGVRITSTDWADGGWTIEESVVFAQQLKARGCDYVCASSGGSTPEQKIPIGPGYQVPLAERIRTEAGIATIAVGLINEPGQAEDIVSGGKADLVALGRGMLYNPRWAWHAAEALGANVYFPHPYERCHPSLRGSDFLKPFRDAKPAS